MANPHDIHIPLETTAGTCPPLDLFENLPATMQAEVLRTIVDSVSEAIVVHNIEGKLTFFNEGARRMLGYSVEEMYALEPFGWVAPHMKAGAPERTRRVISAGSASFQSSAIRKDGSIAATDVSARRAMTCNGPVVVAVIRDLSERAEAETRLIHLAYHDALTGLPNRASLDDRLGAAITDSKRYGDILAVAYIDLDRFKPINDTFGHEIGDAVLIELGRRLMGCVRAQDFVARIGGDEFVVLLPRLSGVDELQQIAERIIAEVRKPFSEEGVDRGIDVSIGFVLFDPQVDDARSLIVKADVAMYAAKRDPRGSWQVWNGTLGRRAPSS